MVDPIPLATAVRAELRAAADPSLAPAQQAYMKSPMPFLGVRVPAVRAAVRQIAEGEKDSGLLQAAALDLWRSAEFREERYAALAVMALPPLRGDVATLPVHEEMIRTGAWWDLVDEAAHRLRELLDAAPGVSATIRVWSRDGDMWIRRAAIICQVGRRADTDRALLSDVVVPNLGDPEFFIRKAIGWALRDLARTAPDWVREFAARHELSPLSRREALKHLT
ncbi:DNA alkylation repair protein [Tsukamurella sp. 8F]|uniref:DNA alkylation repair protein n=1 Tax=unclassified Tsukamurella TaxID=2633480 RepID=UPI0023B9825B|nr:MULTISPECIES: DNA alkylation repair protein [unclassified Tsukamurella]MDF0531836.1 DNA alkylation repair protein [Tsukamurella sp. 8J]MDF0589086.1 DNA alkylation repair protein [Tsukamurella sp. 8F]